MDLRSGFELSRKFDMCLCLEVAEHLPEESAKRLIDCIANHSSSHVLFSAAIPLQSGDHHINCQAPEYWQRLFNDAGFTCYDCVRKDIYDSVGDCWWYAQNMFYCVRDENGNLAGKEPRIQHWVHPLCLDSVVQNERNRALSRRILTKVVKMLSFS